MKTVSVRELSQGGASRAVAASDHEPVLVTKNGEPAAWMIGARPLAALAGGPEESIYRDAMHLLAIQLYDLELLSMGRAARLAGLPMAEFIALASKLNVPVLRRPPGGLAAELAGLEAAASGRSPSPTVAQLHAASLRVVPVPHVSSQSIRVTVGRAELSGDEANEGDYLPSRESLALA